MEIEEFIEGKILELSEITGVVKKDLLDLEKKELTGNRLETFYIFGAFLFKFK